jgi:CRP-like cAMP-binding protein
MQDRIDTERLILEIDITNEELVKAANITLYTASRILSAWQRTDAIRKQRRNIVVLRTERLFLRVA